MPNRLGGSSPQSPGRRVFMIVLGYGILSLFNCMALRDKLHTPMARCSLFVLKMPLNTKKTRGMCTLWRCRPTPSLSGITFQGFQLIVQVKWKRV